MFQGWREGLQNHLAEFDSLASCQTVCAYTQSPAFCNVSPLGNIPQCTRSATFPSGAKRPHGDHILRERYRAGMFRLSAANGAAIHLWPRVQTTARTLRLAPERDVKKPAVRRRIPRKRHGQANIAVTPKADGRDEIQHRANEERPERHAALCLPMETLPSISPAAQASTTDTTRS